MIQKEADQYLKASSKSATLLRIGLYVIILVAPLLVAITMEPKTDHPFIQELAKNLAMVGFSTLAMQFVLSARYRWIERPFGLDVIFQFHRSMGVFAGIVLLAHPLLYASADEWNLLFGLGHSWMISLGKVAFLALSVLVASTVLRKAFSLEFETWRGIHNGLALSVLLLGFAHSIGAGGDFEGWPMRILWIALVVLAFGSYVYHKVLHPQRLRQNSYKVVHVEQETHDAWSLEMVPRDAAAVVKNIPGQFCFLTLYRDGMPIEEHPFTIASAPNASARVVTTIKASGDYTKTIARTCVGDYASISGPYGRFSYVLHPEEDDLVFIAGGVGITPMLSMLRHMQATKADLSVLLLYANRHQRDIIAHAELGRITAGDHPKLNVVHVISKSDKGWTGEKGRIDEALLRRHVDQFDQKAFYVCGPPAMTRAVTTTLCLMGVSEHLIYTESFSL